mmetsp:Transcript_28224/g.45425  ORF Transcript_28224/g.45425 Transcript_28224/m.45425 type:complete len:243 (+) Transcript_28224:130-858(+)
MSVSLAAFTHQSALDLFFNANSKIPFRIFLLRITAPTILMKIAAERGTKPPGPPSTSFCTLAWMALSQRAYHVIELRLPQLNPTTSCGIVWNPLKWRYTRLTKSYARTVSANIVPGTGEEGHQTGGCVRRLSVENTDKNARDEAWLLGIPGSVCFAPSGLASLITRLRILFRTALTSAPTTIFNAIAFLRRRKLRATTPDTNHFVEHPTSFTGNGICLFVVKAISSPSFSIAFTMQLLPLTR